MITQSPKETKESKSVILDILREKNASSQSNDDDRNNDPSARCDNVNIVNKEEEKNSHNLEKSEKKIQIVDKKLNIANAIKVANYNNNNKTEIWCIFCNKGYAPDKKNAKRHIAKKHHLEN